MLIPYLKLEWNLDWDLYNPQFKGCFNKQKVLCEEFHVATTRGRCSNTTVLRHRCILSATSLISKSCRLSHRLTETDAGFSLVHNTYRLEGELKSLLTCKETQCGLMTDFNCNKFTSQKTPNSTQCFTDSVNYYYVLTKC